MREYLRIFVSDVQSGRVKDYNFGKVVKLFKHALNYDTGLQILSVVKLS